MKTFIGKMKKIDSTDIDQLMDWFLSKDIDPEIKECFRRFITAYSSKKFQATLLLKMEDLQNDYAEYIIP